MASPAILPENDPFVRAITRAVHLTLRKAMIRVTIALAVAFCLMIALGFVAWQAYGVGIKTQNTAVQLKADSIANCTNNNAFRKSSAQVLDHILTATLGKAPSSAAIAFVKSQEKYISTKYAPKNCQALYSNVIGKSSASGPAPEPSTVRVVIDSVNVQSWYGGCLFYAGKARAGARVIRAPHCPKLAWRYYSPAGQLRPASNTSLAVGISGTKLELVKASDSAASTLNVDGFRSGPGGFQYSRLFLSGHANSYFYAHAVHQDVTFARPESANGSEYWVLIDDGDVKALL